MSVGYKFLARGAVGPISRVQWPQPIDGAPGAWLGGDGPLVQCRSGVHLMRRDDLAYWLHDELWLVELDGNRADGIDCVLAERARLVRRIDAWHEGAMNRFAAAARDHLVELAATAPAKSYERVAAIIGDTSRRLALGTYALAAYDAAIGVARLSPDESAAYRRERKWQSDWIARELSLE